MTDKENYVTRETLLAKLKNKHDDASWEDFVFYYKSYIYIICRRMNLSHHDAEEVVQKVLMTAWKKLPDFKYNKKQRFRGWLCKVTKDSVNEFFRSAKRQSTKVDRVSEYSVNDKFSDPDIEKIAEEEWKAYIAGMALDNIKDNFSEQAINVFTKLSEGKSRSIVAEELGLPVNTVSVYKKRVTVKLRSEIRRLYHDLGEI